MRALVEALVLAALLAAAAGVVWLTLAGLVQSWRGWRARRAAAPRWLAVVGRDDVTSDVFCIALAPTRPWQRPAAWEPGQHVVLHVPAGDGPPTRRAYSLAAWDRKPRAYPLGIKREAEGMASRWLHENARPGRRILASPPKGAFHRELARGAAEVALIAGGIGITPMRAMLQAWADHPRPPRVTLHFSAREQDQLYFDAEFRRLAADRPWFTYLPRLTRPAPGWSGAAGRLEAGVVLAGLRDATAATVFLCANRAMEDAVVTGLVAAGLDPARIHRESFGIEAAATDIRAAITFRGRTFPYDGAPTLLHALLAQGFDIPAECRAGECGSCRLAIARGRTRHLLTGAETSSSALACCAVPLGDLELAG
jgi:ferredoxin-NADP reductase